MVWVHELPCDDTELTREQMRWISDVQLHSEPLDQLPEAARAVRQVVLSAIERDVRNFAFAAPELQADPDVALAAVRKDGRLLRRLPESLAGDRSITMAAVEQTSDAYQYASFEMRSDSDIALTAAQDTDALAFVPESLWADEAFVLRAVVINGWVLKYIGGAFLEDHTIVLHAVQQSWHTLIAAPPKLQCDPEIAFAALRQDKRALAHVPLRAFSNRDFLVSAAQNNMFFIHLRHGALRHHDEVEYPLERTVRNSVVCELREDRDFVLAIVERDGLQLEHAVARLQADEEIVLTAVMANGEAMKFAAASLLANPGIVRAAVARNGSALRHVGKDMQAEFEVVLEAVQKNGLALRYAAKELQSNPLIGLAAVKQNAKAIKFAPKECQAYLKTMSC